MVSVNTKVKIIVLGASGTGKSSLCRQYVQQVFEDAYEPTVEALFEKELYLCNKSVSVTLLDTAGQEDTNKTKEEYLAEGDGFVLVFSITDASTFHDIEGLYEDIITKKEGSSVPIVVIGNKCDLKHLRSITTEEAKNLVSKMGQSTTYVETSAKQCVNVDKAFEAMVDLIGKNRPELLIEEDEVSSSSMPGNGGTKLRKKKRCSLM